MSVVDTVIKNGRICTSRDIFEADIAINQGKIVGIGTSEYIPKADEVIDIFNKRVHIEDLFVFPTRVLQVTNDHTSECRVFLLVKNLLDCVPWFRRCNLSV